MGRVSSRGVLIKKGNGVVFEGRELEQGNLYYPAFFNSGRRKLFILHVVLKGRGIKMVKANDRWTLWLVLLGFITGTLLVLGVTSVSHGADRVLTGVRVAGVDLSGLDREGCQQVLASLEKELNTSTVVLRYQDRSWNLSAQRIDLHMDTQAIITRALKVGHEGTWWKQWQQRQQVKQEGFMLPVVVVLNREKFYQELDALGKEITTPPQDAAFRVLPNDRIEIIPGHDGMKVDQERAYRDLLAALAAGKKAEIELGLVQVKPRTTTEEVESMGLKGLLATYTTRFDASDTDRAYNIRVAAAALDGLLVPPGQEVSFNKVVGPRSSEAGYKNAKVIINNQLVDGLGGGVCQVSTTLYNAVLLANLEILDRSNHSLPVSYVPIGRDATVVYGVIDFRFRNNTESYIYLRSFIRGDQLVVKIYGNTDYKVPVEIRTRVMEVLEPKVIRQADPNLKRGEEVIKQKAARGYRVVAQRVVWENGQPHTEPLPGSFYHPVDQLIAVGTGEPSSGPVVPLPRKGGQNPGQPVPEEKPPASENASPGYPANPGVPDQPFDRGETTPRQPPPEYNVPDPGTAGEVDGPVNEEKPSSIPGTGQ